MTKKDYVALAAAIAESASHKNGFNSTDLEVVRDLVSSMCAVFMRDKLRFDKARFLKACGIES